MTAPPKKPASPKRRGVFLPSTEELRTLAGTDRVLRFMMDNGLPMTRDSYIAINWGPTSKPWTHEHEAEMPDFLQDLSAVQGGSGRGRGGLAHDSKAWESEPRVSGGAHAGEWTATGGSSGIP